MKKVTLLLTLAIMLGALFGCTSKEEKQYPDWKRYDLQEFKPVFSHFAKQNDIQISSTQIDAFGDITPENVFKETGCQIFKNKETYESYLLYDGNIYTLGIGFGGLGVVDVETSDFNGNGEKELLYTYSWGSGMHRSCLGYFDLSKKCEGEISSVDSLGLVQEELILKKISDTQFEVYKATPTRENEESENFSLKEDILFARIKEVENRPALILQ